MEASMKKAELSIPELSMVAGTRAAAGAGIALLLSDRLSAERRKAVGWSLLAFGAISTIPLALHIFRPRRGGNGKAEEIE
jgi:hypothetical protein